VYPVIKATLLDRINNKKGKMIPLQARCGAEGG